MIMKKRDRFWIKHLLYFLPLIFLFGTISFCNILQFNNTYMQEEKEELQRMMRQVIWSIKPFLEDKDFITLQKYCDDFHGEDVTLRIFDQNKKIIASTDGNNLSPLIEHDSAVVYKKYNKLKLYRHSTKDKKLFVVKTVKYDNFEYYIELTVSQAEVMKSITEAQKSILIFISICIMLFMFGLIQIFYALRTDFNKLEDSVIEIANGNLDKEIEIPKLELLAELAISVRKMTMRLKNQISRLIQLEQYKANFLQNVTHEIKTPITAINSAVQLLEATDTKDKNSKECFSIIRFQIQAINKLVNDILYLSEIEVEKTDENKKFKTFNLNSMIKNVMENFNYSDVTLNFTENAQIDINANEESLSIMLSNLISNAIKYSNTKTVDITLNKNPDNSTELIVKDYGIGIDKIHHKQIFDRFYRVDKARSRATGGTGLGLAIVKSIVELHGGKIKLESEPGAGTSFIINL